MNKKERKKILLHACCAPCTVGVYEQLKDKYNITLFWYNPNIFPKNEHDRRLNELLNYCDDKNIRILVGDYFWEEEHDFFLKQIKGLEKEPERGKRCLVCYQLRIEATASVAANINNHHHKTFDLFSSELSISPHKKAEAINNIGKKIAQKYELEFLAADFKKKNGYQKACQISQELKLYRQKYCGCEFSMI